MLLMKRFASLALLLCLALPIGIANAADQKITLTVAMHASDPPTIWEPVFQKYEALNPHIDVNSIYIANAEYVDKMRVMLVSNTMPDVLKLSQQVFATLAYDNALLDLTDFIRRDWKVYDFDDIVPGLFDMWKHQGKFLGVPYNFNPVLVSYNTDAFAEAALAPPKWDWTWDDLLETGRKLVKMDSENKVVRYGWDTVWNLLSFEAWARSGGSYLISEDGQSGLTTRKTLEAFQFFQDLTYTHRVGMPRNVSLPGVTFANGRIAMQHDGHWNVPQYLKNKELKWAMTRFPYRKGEVGKTVYGGALTAVGITTKHVEEAWKLAAFMASEEAQKLIVEDGLSMPVRRSLIQKAINTTKEYDQRVFINAMSDAVVFPVPPTYAEAQKVLVAALRPVIRGEKGAIVFIPSVAGQFAEALKH